jgi:hypothetical protein
VKEYAGKSSCGNSMWNCVCDCGNSKTVEGSHLRSGATKSCGCLSKEFPHNFKHGQSKRGLTTQIYKCWVQIMQRCYNPKHKHYKNYGGRGIKVCDRWHVFENFYVDMGDCPLGLSLDRRDNNGNYELGNCRWATSKEQMNNREYNVWYTHKGETKNITQWARHLGMSVATLCARLNELGWSIEKALTTPVRKWRRV